MVELQKEPNSELTQEQQEFLVKLDMDILKAKNFLKRCDYVILTKQELTDLKWKVVIMVLLAACFGIINGFTLCKMVGG